MMCVRTFDSRTMLVATLFVLVSVVGANVNSTGVSGASRMAWMKSLLDHHNWMEYINGSLSLPQKCETDLRIYLTALNDGQLWASKTTRQADSHANSYCVNQPLESDLASDAGIEKRVLAGL
ncbi:hypothetical protein B5X24_HaOG201204 [Helicoverpa armigera]|nr:hypothetical protein B5X24_HaOG201204 [Helicoverpa armigera]